MSSIRVLLNLAGKCLEQCRSAEDASQIVSLLHSVACPDAAKTACNKPSISPAEHVDDDGGALHSFSRNLRQLELQHNLVLDAFSKDINVVVSWLYWIGYDELFAILLPAMEESWWPNLPAHHQAQAASILNRAPAPVALAALSGYASSMSAHQNSASSVRVSALGAITAARMVQQRFTGSQAPGLLELVRYLAIIGNMTQPATYQPQAPTLQLANDVNKLAQLGTAQADEAGVLVPSPDLLLPPEQGPLAASRLASYQHLLEPDHIAGLLVSLPDRLTHFRQGCPAHEEFYTDVLSQLLQHLRQVVDGPAVSSVEAVTVSCARLVYNVMSRLCGRGYTQVVADVLLNQLQQGSSHGTAQQQLAAQPARQTLVTTCILPGITLSLLSHPRHCSKLLQALLISHSRAHSSLLTWTPWRQEESGKQPAATALEAAKQLLGLLGGPAALAGQPELRFAATEQLLSQHTLPSPALHLLLLLLGLAASCSTSGGNSQPPGQPEVVTDKLSSRQWWLEQLLGADALETEQPLGPGQPYVAVSEVLSTLAALWSDVTPAGNGRTAQHVQQTGGSARRVPTAGPEAQAATARAGAAVQRQAYLSCVLMQLLAGVTKCEVETCPGLLASLLSGVSTRLNSPLPAVRRQAMRVGQALSRILSTDGTLLFEDQGSLDLLQEELWPGAVSHTPPATKPAGGGSTMNGGGLKTQTASAGGSQAVGGVQAGGRGAHRRDDESEADSDDDSLEALDLQEEEPAAQAWSKPDPRSLQLRSVAAALRKTDDVQGVLDALGKVEVLVRAQPDELAVCANELTRALLHCRVPEWVEEDPGTRPEDKPEAQRVLSLAALTASAPLPGGDALLLEVLSPHLDVYQRLLILQSLAAAAQELSNPGVAPKLQYVPGQVPRLVYPPAAADSAQPPSLTPGHSPHPAAALPSRSTSSSSGQAELAVSKTRVWGHVALKKKGKQAAPVHRNTFADWALRWTHGLLREVDKVKHGVDLLGRDSLVLSSLLQTLGVFAECSSSTPAAVPVCQAIIELLAAPQVHGHLESAVRRSALLVAGQILAALPAARVAAALSGSQAGQAADDNLVHRLRWMQSWLVQVHHDDSDDKCRAMSGACNQLYAALAAEAAVHTLGLDSGHLGGAGALPGAGSAPAGSLVSGPLGMVRQQVVLLPHQVGAL